MNRTANDRTRELLRRQYQGTGVFLSMEAAETLRRAELTLNRWDEKKCGWNTDHASFALTRAEVTNLPYLEVHPYRHGDFYLTRIPDLEAGALRRVAIVCRRNGLDYFHQGDPTGCALYISKAGAGMNDTNYNQFVACSVN